MKIKILTSWRSVYVIVLFCYINPLSAQDCPESNSSKNGQCMRVQYADAQAALNALTPTNETIVVTNSTTGADGTWTSVSTCGDGSEVLFKLGAANCNCSGAFGSTEGGDFSYNVADITCTYLPNGTLPVEYSSFNGVVVEGEIFISWKTVNEINNEGFEIERSSNGHSFEKIGFVGGSGTNTNETSYRFIDRDAFPGMNYYRLKQFDFNGQYNFSDIIKIDFEDPRKFLEISSINHDNTLYFITHQPVRNIKIFDLQGLLISTQNLNYEIGEQYLNTSNLTSGNYFIIATNYFGHKQVLKFIKI